MIAMALNEEYHAMIRTILAPFAVGNKGLMQKRGGVFYICSEKGFARMDGKRVTDHASAPGCRPALNIDVLRVLAVFASAKQLLDGAEALREAIGGCARMKVRSCCRRRRCCCCLWCSDARPGAGAHASGARSLRPARWASPRPTRPRPSPSTCGS